MGDGLNQFANLIFEPELYRERWEQCSGLIDNGSDCLTTKGFSHSVVSVDDVKIDVVNFHMDAGQSEADVAAREVQVAQMLRFVEMLPNDQALIMAGDTNLKIEGDLDESARDINQVLLEALDAEASDVCWTLGCDEPTKIDRVFYKGMPEGFVPTSWSVDERFINDAGVALSDHEAVRVSFGPGR